MTTISDRPRYFEGQYLQAADLMAAVDYTASQRARMLLGAHRWGIAFGLQLVEVKGPNSSLDVVVQPGYAWDGFGRPIVVPDPAKLSVGLFSTFDALFVPGQPPPSPVVVDVWIRYDEAMGQAPRPGFETCDPGLAFSRVVERFAIEVGPRPDVASRRDPIVIAGRTMDAAQALVTFDPSAQVLEDASVPHQTLPAEGEHALWLLPLGVVMYLPGSPGKFVPRTPDALTRNARSRQYAGVVAGSIEATSGVVRVHDRGRPYSSYFTSELLAVEGDIRSDGDVRIYDGHRLEFASTHLESPVAPFQVRRKDDLGLGTTSLHLVIGDKTAGHNRLAVGPRSGVDASGADVLTAGMVVTDKGFVGIGTEEPKALLHLAESGLQIGASATPTDNFHLQSDVVGVRGLRVYNKDAPGGDPLLTITPTGQLGVGETSPTSPLHVKGAVGIRQNAIYLSGDSKWSSLTFNAHHNSNNGSWVFPDTTTPAATIEMDAIGGWPRFEVFTTRQGNNQDWVSHLRVHGHSGDVTACHSPGVPSGRFGIGTFTPQAKLDVQGDIAASGDIRLGGLSALGSGPRTRVVWGAVRSGGVTEFGDGFTITKVATGRTKITFTAPFTGSPVVLVTRVHGDIFIDAGNAVTASETAVVDVVGVDSTTVATADGAGNLADGAFTFVAFGPR
ncbi:MAG: hypothetical protein ABI873_15985 [Marmoricola sp.]